MPVNTISDAPTNPRPRGHISRRGPRGGHSGARNRGRSLHAREGVPLLEGFEETPPSTVAPATCTLTSVDSDRTQLTRDTRSPRPLRARGNGGLNRAGPTREARGGIRGGSGNGHNHGLVHGTSRQFGGRLTDGTDSTSARSTQSSLKPDAPEFTPGHDHHHQPRSIPRRGGKPAVTPKKPSTATDMPTKIHEDIDNGIYECPICTAAVHRKSQVWSSDCCWTVFHLSCIRKWSQNEGSAVRQPRDGNGEVLARQWRCPGCNTPRDVLPNSFSTCWCGKAPDPQPIPGLPPHTCGQTCGRPLLCPHICNLLCHAGKCAPCNAMGPTQFCYCGKKSTQRKCIETNYKSGWSCGEICGDPLPCGEHYCQRPCHEGFCGACEADVEAKCYCWRKVTKTLLCCEQGEERDSERQIELSDGSFDTDSWTGTFECGEVCDRLYDCGLHKCEKPCHPQDLEVPPCPRSASQVTRCPCDRTPLSEILDHPRTSCTDPIPNCTKECSKLLRCGHHCRQICHQGACLPCLETVSIECRCGRVSSKTICHQGSEEKPQCARICRAVLNCGRHECQERCCPGEKRAVERQALKRKMRPLGSTSRAVDDGFEVEHICTRLCGRLLKCGNHTCPDLCHRGPCESCREAIFEEITCHCSRTVLQPPLPCGVTPPVCRFECERPTNCGHPRVPHNCHLDQESCPKCPFLISKTCMCGRRTLKNMPCWLQDVQCGEICGRKLKCGSHFCQTPCHRPGECEDVGRKCQQPCDKSKKICGHSCEEPCHAPSICREDKPCQSKMLITCPCQHLKQEVKCNASKSSEGNTTKTLKCDDECARLERNRKLALALNVDPDSHKDDHIPYSTPTLTMFAESTKWAQTQEREFRVFATDEKEKRLRFKPMPNHQRAFIHSLAEDFGLDHESLDPEPHRHVFVLKTPRFVAAPNKTLAECLRIRNQNATLTTTSSAPASSRKALPATFESFNAFLLINPRFGLTIEELRTDLHTTLSSTPSLKFDISFLPSEQVALKASSTSHHLPSSTIETHLKSMKSALASQVYSMRVASDVRLCTLDASLNVLHLQDDSSHSASGGWSQVAATAAGGPRTVPRWEGVGAKSSFTVLGRGEARKKKEREEKERRERKGSVVEDWEEAMRKEEEEEEKETEMETEENQAQAALSAISID